MQLALERLGPRRISLTPLVDVVFILLFFFMLATRPDQWRSLPVTLQSESRSASGGDSHGISESEKSDSFVVLVSDIGIEVPGRGEISVDGLIEQLSQQRPADNASQRIVLVPRESVRFQRLLTVTDLLSVSGATVAFAENTGTTSR